jgi:hypothetical protein
MRRSVRAVVSASVVLMVASGSAWGQPSPDRPKTVGEASRNKDSLTVDNRGATVPGAKSQGSPASSNNRRTEPLPEHVITRYHLATAPDGSRCLDEVTTRRDTPMTENEVLDNNEAIRFANALGIGRCPDDAGAASVITPAEVAEPFVRTIPMPVPDPRIPPGHAITGLPAYLETRGTLSHRVGPEPTALGSIEVHATGAYYVDWGDGSPEEGPFAFEGEAYPAGRIVHSYRDTGTYTVTVRVAWSADWRLGGDSGTVPGLQTEASIPLEVRQLQAVRLR